MQVSPNPATLSIKSTPFRDMPVTIVLKGMLCALSMVTLTALKVKFRKK